jgi:hypothetical protein
VKLRGHRIELGEIEAVLGRAKGVRTAVVIAAGEGGEKHLVGYVVGEQGSGSELRTYLKEKLPEYMVPAHIVTLPEMPLTLNGKVDRKALPKPEALGVELVVEYVSPGTELETRLCELWAEVLGLPRVGIYDNFFDLGGHSLLILPLVITINRELKQNLNVIDIFQHSSVSSLSTYLLGGVNAIEEDGKQREAGRHRADMRRTAVARRSHRH